MAAVGLGGPRERGVGAHERWRTGINRETACGVSFTRCVCPPVLGAYGEPGDMGHLTVACGGAGVPVGVVHAQA